MVLRDKGTLNPLYLTVREQDSLVQSSETLHLPTVPGEDNAWFLKLKRLEHISFFDVSHGEGVVERVGMAESVRFLDKLSLTLS